MKRIQSPRPDQMEYIRMMNAKEETNKETIESKKFQEWLIQIKLERVRTTNFISDESRSIFGIGLQHSTKI